jgi:hypothetical protein
MQANFLHLTLGEFNIRRFNVFRELLTENY